MKRITLAHGGGGAEMNILISEIRKRLGTVGNWSSYDDDSAIHPAVDGKLVFTTDSYVVSPVFFAGGNIGDLAFCGTVNDLCVMGAQPLGVSLALVLEEGLLYEDLFRIIDAIAKHSAEVGVPVVTGDTKVMGKGGVDKIVITTSGVGVVEQELNHTLTEGDKIIVSGGLAEHACALLAQRYGMKTDLISDVKPLHEEMRSVKDLVKVAKDLTRGGLAAALNEISTKHSVKLRVEQEAIPLSKAVTSMTNILGMEALELASEGRIVIICSEKNSKLVLGRLQAFNEKAAIIGEVDNGRRVVVKTKYGERILNMPSGVIAPRIC